MGRVVLVDGARFEQSYEFIAMYDYRTACRHRAYDYLALVWMLGIGTMRNGHWLAMVWR